MKYEIWLNNFEGWHKSKQDNSEFSTKEECIEEIGKRSWKHYMDFNSCVEYKIVEVKE